MAEFVALLAEGVDRNSRRSLCLPIRCPSPSSRRAWIEITLFRCMLPAEPRVVLLAEGVDRNDGSSVQDLPAAVALLAEGVDRKTRNQSCTSWLHWSPSSRRAWIENFSASCAHRRRCVALLAEGVDRNCWLSKSLLATASSPSSRRAWIEIPPMAKSSRRTRVALLTEGVDRNSLSSPASPTTKRRPPRGGRG